MNIESEYTENYDLSSYITIPFGGSNNVEPQYQEIKVIENFMIKRLDDGSIHLVDNSQIHSDTTINAQESVINLNNSELTNSANKNIIVYPQQKLKSVLKTQTTATKNSSIPCLIAPKPVSPKQSSIVFKCLKCGEQCTSLPSYRKHLKQHQSEKKFSCTKCSAGYNIENNLKIHIITAHPSYSDTCPICKIKFQRKASLKSHILVHQVEELHSCDECQAEFESEDDLLKHIELHAISKASTNNALVCAYCRLEFKTSQEYKSHIALHITLKKTILKGKRTRKRRSGGKSGYICKVCGKSFAKSCLLERHERIHTGEKPFVCQYCKRGFAQKGTLQIHLNKHTGIKPYACVLCPAKFNQKGNLRAHIDKTHTAPKGDQKMYKCSQCACIFRKIASLNGHVTKTHLSSQPNHDGENEEDVVGDVLKNLEILRGDQNSQKPVQSFTNAVDNNVNCDINNVSEAVEEPDKDYEKESLVRLTECHVNGTVRRYLVKQKKIGEVRWYFCNYCSSRFKKPSDLIRHLRVHTREKPFQCTKCNVSFSLKSTLLNHMKTHTAAPFSCSHCHSVFRNSKCLNAHLRRHERNNARVPEYVCTLCKKDFPNLELAKLHRNEHQHEIVGNTNVIQPYLKQPLFKTTYGCLPLKPPKSKFPNTGTESPTDRPYHCTICDSRFARMINLKRHIQLHNGDRRFKCHICPKAFITKYRLKEHLNYHRNIRNYACKVCSKRFVTASLMKRHLIVHNTHRPYMCPYCVKNFKTLLLCRTHIKNVHKLDASTTVIITDPEPSESKILPGKNVPESIPIDDHQSSSVQVFIQDPILKDYKQVPNDQNSVLLNIPQGTSDDPSQVTYQTIFVNLEVPTGNEVTSSAEFPQNNTLLNNIQDGLIFTMDKSSMVDPNDVFLPPKPEMPKTLPSIDEISMKLNNFNNKSIKQNSTFEQTDNMSRLLDNLQNVELNLPVNILENGQINSNENMNFLTANVPSGSGGDMFNDSHVICINCHKVYDSMEYFQGHNCEQSEKKIIKQETGESFRIGDNDLLESTDNLETTDSIDKEVKEDLKCSLCTKIFQSQRTLEKHMALSHIDKVFMSKTCKFCFKEFKKPSDLKRHLRIHTGEKPFACNLCDKKFSLKSTLQSHQRTHEPEMKGVTCDVCNSQFSTKSSLKVHMLLHSGQKPFGCSFCDLTFRTLGAKSSHEKTKHIMKGKNSPTKIKPTALLQSVAEQVVSNLNLPSTENNELLSVDNLNVCEVQPNMDEEQSFSQKPNLVSENHQVLIPTLQEDIMSSNIIANINGEPLTLDPMSLLQHLQNSGILITTEASEGIEEAVPIHLSDITLLDFKTLEDNIQVATLPEVSAETLPKSPVGKRNVHVKKKDVERVECDICHKLYASKDVLRKHKKKVHGQNKKFPCIKCDKGYDTSAELNKHIKLHTGYRPYSCQYCANSFSEEQNLKTHIKRIHQKCTISQETSNALLDLQLDLSSLNNVDDVLI